MHKRDTCDLASGFDGSAMGARIASIFVLLAVSSFGAFFPLLANKWKWLRLPTNTLFLVKHFGTGVILATAFIHLLGEAQDSLSNSCLTGIWEEYSWASGISLMGTFTMFLIELAVNQYVCRTRRFKDFRDEEYEREDVKSGEIQDQRSDQDQKGNSDLVELQNFSCSKHSLDEPAFKKLTSLFLLEFGIVFHSVFVGLSLAIAGDEFKTLFVAISFHQFFEGLGLALRFATTDWPQNMRLVPWIFSLIYSFTTPIGIAVGLGVRHLYSNNLTGSLIVVGVFDAFCSGLLIYNCLVELMAQDYLIEPDLQNSSGSRVWVAYVMLASGTILMAVIGRWA